MLLHRWQWVLLAMLVIGVGVSRGLLSSGPPSQDLLSTRSAEMEHIWFRITPYPGIRQAGAQVDKQVTETSVVNTRRWSVDADWPSVRAHYERALADAAWHRVGETRTASGQQVLLYRQDPFHMVVSLSGNILELRATWSADGNPLLQ